MLVSRVNAPMREQTVKGLRNAILQGKFKPGERLYERKLCELLGVSRTSIREALRHLESECLIKGIPQKGPIVAAITVDEAKDIYEVREVLESFACRLFAERANSAAISGLRRSTDLVEKYLQEGDIGNQIIESDNFYRIILEGCGNKVVCSFLNSLRARINFLRATSLSQKDRPLYSARELRNICTALEKHDPKGAWEASCDHVREAKSIALSILRNLLRWP